MKKAVSLLLSLICLVSLAACSGGGAKNADLVKVMEEIEKQVTMSDMMEITENDLKSVLGVDPVDVKQFAAKIKSTGTEYDQVLLFEGIDTDKANNIKKALDTWYEYEKSQTVSYLPEQYAIIEKCSVKQQGNYVSLIVSEQADKINGIYEESFQ